MENKRELNDILINDDDLQKQSRTKKLMMMVAMALIFLSILIAVIFVITREEEGLSDQQIASQTGLNPMDQTSNNNDFVNVPLGKDSAEDDPFAKIIDDIKKRNESAQSTSNMQKETIQPIPEKPVEQVKPVLPPKPAPAAPKQPAQPAPKPATPTPPKPAPAAPKQPAQPAPKPATPTPPKPAPAAPKQPAQPAQEADKPAQNNKDITNAFENISTSSIDTSKNGQVAEKGFYVQVGSFANKPSAEFLKKIGNYSYRVYAGTSSNGQTTTKYLIGPYKSRTDAARDLGKFTTLVSDPIHFEVK